MEFDTQAEHMDSRAVSYATGPLVGLSRTTGASVCKQGTEDVRKERGEDRWGVCACAAARTD